MTKKWNLCVGDVLQTLQDEEDNSFDAIYCDPPYGLSDKSPKDIEDRLLDTFGNVLLPNLEKVYPQLIENLDLSTVTLDGSLLSRKKVVSIIDSWVSVPESAIDFDCDIEVGEEEVQTGAETPRSGISDTVLPEVQDSESVQFLGNFFLDFRDTIEFAGRDSLGCRFTEFLSGGFSMPVSPTFSPSDPSLLASLLSTQSSLRTSIDLVGLSDNTGGGSQTSTFIRALTRAVNSLMLRFNLSHGTLELGITDRALQGNSITASTAPKLVGARPRTSSLPSMFKPVRVRLVDFTTNRALPYYIHVYLHDEWANKLQKAFPTKGFMGKEWDRGVPSPEVWAEALRVLKPGGFLLAFGGTRMWHRLAVNIEDAGFEIRDTLMWLYGTGFPKAYDISKGVTKTLPEDLVMEVKAALQDAFKASGMTGAEANRQCGFTFTDYLKTEPPKSDAGGRQTWWQLIPTGEKWETVCRIFDVQMGDIAVEKLAKVKGVRPQGAASGITYGTYSQEVRDYALTDEAARWEGYKTALKPAWEPIVVAMKPIEGTYAANALEHGVAGLNIDGSRITTSSTDKIALERANTPGSGTFKGKSNTHAYGTMEGKSEPYDVTTGRFPANLVLSHTPDCVPLGSKKVGSGVRKKAQPGNSKPFDDGKGWNSHSMTREGQTAPENYGTETVENWDCSPECPIRQLDEQTGTLVSGTGAVKRSSSRDKGGNTGSALGAESRPDGTPMISYADSGGASRFFYNAKASKSEREAGLEPVFGENGKKKRANTHPTVKPIDLNRYFTKLILPPEREDEPRKLLVPFSGVGSEMIGALLAGWDEVTGIEISPDYVAIAEVRLQHWTDFEPDYPVWEAPEPEPVEPEPDEITFEDLFKP